MKILYIQPAEGFGGAERQSIVTIKNLPSYGLFVIPAVGPGEIIVQSLKSEGVSNFYFCDKLPTDVDCPPGRNILVHILSVAISLFSTIIDLKRIIKKNDIDLIYASRTIGWVIGSSLGLLCRIPVIWRAGSRTTSRLQRFILALTGLFYKPLAIICNCRAVENNLASLIKCPIYTIANGIDLEHFNPVGAFSILARRLNIDGHPVIGIAARPANGKGFTILHDVVKILVAKIPNVQVLIAGEFNLRKHYENLFKEMDVRDNVRFLGHVQDMRAFYSSCDLVLLTSRQKSIEGFPNALLEAMAMEKPVVATNVGGIGEMITHGVEGFLCEPTDVEGIAGYIEKIIKDPFLAYKMGRAGRKRVREEFAKEITLSKLASTLFMLNGEEALSNVTANPNSITQVKIGR